MAIIVINIAGTALASVATTIFAPVSAPAESVPDDVDRDDPGQDLICEEII